MEGKKKQYDMIELDRVLFLFFGNEIYFIIMDKTKGSGKLQK